MRGEARREPDGIDAAEAETWEGRAGIIDIAGADRITPIEIGDALAIANRAKGIGGNGVGKIIMGVDRATDGAQGAGPSAGPGRVR